MRIVALALLAALASVAPAVAAEIAAGPEQPSEAWTELRAMIYGDREIAPAGDMIAIDAPYRAHDAAVVPVAVRIDPGALRRVTALTLIVDENPAPVAAEFELGPAMGPVVELSTRLRVNAYSNIRVVAELDDGTLYQAARFVKASGGCSAPALKDAEAALAQVGKMKLRAFEPPAGTSGGRREAQVMIRHPNNSGFQLDPVTQLYIPAFFIHEIVVSQGGERLFRMTGGISLSEDPTIRFTYLPDGAEHLAVRATDTGSGIYTREFETGGS